MEPTSKKNKFWFWIGLFLLFVAALLCLVIIIIIATEPEGIGNVPPILVGIAVLMIGIGIYGIWHSPKGEILDTTSLMQRIVRRSIGFVSLMIMGLSFITAFTFIIWIIREYDIVKLITCLYCCGLTALSYWIHDRL
jgi:hypothetical protein